MLDENQDAGTAFWALPPVLLNIFIILWIYFALTKTMQELVAGGQTFKHKMMQKLSKFSLVSFTLVVDHHRALSCKGGGNCCGRWNGSGLRSCMLSISGPLLKGLGAIRVKLTVGEHHAVEPE